MPENFPMSFTLDLTQYDFDRLTAREEELMDREKFMAVADSISERREATINNPTVDGEEWTYTFNRLQYLVNYFRFRTQYELLEQFNNG